jgi:hypothetical protein
MIAKKLARKILLALLPLLAVAEAHSASIADQPSQNSSSDAFSDSGASSDSDSNLDVPADFVDHCAATPSCATVFPSLTASSATGSSHPDDHQATGNQADDPQPQSAAAAKKADKAARRAARIARDLADPNRNIYYRNRLELGVDFGYLPINIPFAFDIFLGDGYNMTPLKYTLEPIITSIRWHIDNIEGRSIFRGNWDAQCSLDVVPIVRGPETHYVAWMLGIRRNFVPRKIKVAPYFDLRVGLGGINAKGPLGVEFAQGQDFTFTLNVGSGVRYNFNQRVSVSGGVHYMHISNLYLSQPQFPNYGINVYGPMVGIDVRLSKPHHGATE